MKFSNLNVGSRLAVGFGIVLILLIILAGVSIWRLQSVGAALNEITNQGLQKERRTARWATIVEINAARTFAAVKVSDPTSEKFFLDAIAGFSGEITTLQQTIRGELTTPEATAMVESIGERRAAYQVARAAAFKEKAAGNLDGAMKIVTDEMTPKLGKYLDSIRDFQEVEP